MEKKAKIITDKNDKKIVVLPEILFKGKRSLSWNEVKNYLKQYVGKAYLHMRKFPPSLTSSLFLSRILSAE